MIDNLPQDIKENANCLLVLDKIAKYGNVSF